MEIPPNTALSGYLVLKPNLRSWMEVRGLPWMPVIQGLGLSQKDRSSVVRSSSYVFLLTGFSEVQQEVEIKQEHEKPCVRAPTVSQKSQAFLAVPSECRPAPQFQLELSPPSGKSQRGARKPAQ
ncbi:UNVERIFIED_CONTAM: hypothetical protein K2H54_060717, partial [Gekko kuhli]